MTVRQRIVVLVSLSGLAVLIGFFALLPATVMAATLDELRADLEERRSNLKRVEEQIIKFQEEIQERKKQARTLQDQISIIDNDIAVGELSLKRTLAQIGETSAEIETIEEEIAIKEQQIEHQKVLLAQYIRAMHNLDQQSAVTVLLRYQTFSEAISEVATFEELQNRGQEALDRIQQLRDELQIKHRELSDFKETLEALKRRQEDQQRALQGQRASKQNILDLTNAQEQQFQSLLKQAQADHQAAQAEIKRLDSAIREELRKQGIGALPSVGTLSWPLTPSFGISCGFHCAGYPYEYLIGPHTGIDLPANVGTPIVAAADGYVARLHDAGGPGYSYILLLHGDEVSTVYGHVSGFATQEGIIVTRGTVIGYSGGAPGTRGAGLSSGPHLHFEVRVNNIPTDPMKYLPPL